jgi:hypothetical protein
MPRDACTTHCVECDTCFSGTSAFDAHRSGPPEDRRCEDPAEVRDRNGKRLLVVKTNAGTCRLSTPPTVKAPVEIWQLAATAERFAA